MSCEWQSASGVYLSPAQLLWRGSLFDTYAAAVTFSLEYTATDPFRYHSVDTAHRPRALIEQRVSSIPLISEWSRSRNDCT